MQAGVPEGHIGKILRYLKEKLVDTTGLVINFCIENANILLIYK